MRRTASCCRVCSSRCSRIAQLSGQLRASYGIKALDSFIAATALMTGTTLATRNVRDFHRVPNLDIRTL
jgi:predicted nucleic acid-binding protein